MTRKRPFCPQTGQMAIILPHCNVCWFSHQRQGGEGAGNAVTLAARGRSTLAEHAQALDRHRWT